MEQFGQNSFEKRNSLLIELEGANFELGEAFAYVLNNMVVQSGLRNPKAEPYYLVSKSWLKLAEKKDKTDDENETLSNELNACVRDLAKSYLLFIAKETGNLTGKINYSQYEAYLKKHRFGNYSIMNKPEYIAEVETKIKNAFDKISSHGEEGHAEFIDKECMAEYIYALSLSSDRDENNEFKGFKVDGNITPRGYTLDEHLLFEKGENMFSIKLQVAHNMLNRNRS